VSEINSGHYSNQKKLNENHTVRYITKGRNYKPFTVSAIKNAGFRLRPTGRRLKQKKSPAQ